MDRTYFSLKTRSLWNWEMDEKSVLCWLKHCFQNQTSHETTSPVKVVDISNNSYVNISQLYSETHQKYDRNQNSASYPDQNLKEKGYKLNFLETNRKMLNSSKPQTLEEIQSKVFFFYDSNFSWFNFFIFFT